MKKTTMKQKQKERKEMQKKFRDEKINTKFGRNMTTKEKKKRKTRERRWNKYERQE